MNLKELLKEMFDNFPEVAQNYEEDIMDRYDIEVEKNKLTSEEIDNLTNLYFDKPKNNYYIGNDDVVYHIHFGDCKKTRKNNKIYNLKYKNIIKNDTYINKNSKIDTLKNSLNKTL